MIGVRSMIGVRCGSRLVDSGILASSPSLHCGEGFPATMVSSTACTPVSSGSADPESFQVCHARQRTLIALVYTLTSLPLLSSVKHKNSAPPT